MVTRKVILVLVTLAFLLIPGVIAFSQMRIEPDPVPNESYRIRVINEMGVPICVKIIPYGRATYFHADLAPGRSKRDRLWGGNRIVCVWHDRTGEVLLATGVRVNRNGILRIRPVWAEPMAAPAEGGVQPKTAMPMLEIEPEQ